MAEKNGIASLWKYIELGEYELPSLTIAHTIQGGMSGFSRKLRRKLEEMKMEAYLRKEDELNVIDEALLQEIVPIPDWSGAATILEEHLQKDVPTILVTPPYGGGAEILTLLAQKHRWRAIEPPSAEQILNQDMDWLHQFTNQSAPWVLTNLEKCYFRHVSGLTLVRQFFEKLYCGLLGQGVIGCDSWAWAYFEHICHGGKPRALTLQSFDDEKLVCWFQNLMGHNKETFLFRQSNNGAYVFPADTEKTVSAKLSNNINDFLIQLAFHCRGNPSIAWSFWSIALSVENDKAPKTEVENNKKIIWVLSWEKLRIPMLPSKMEARHSMVLHTLLLHNGLPYDVLEKILPFPSGEIMQILITLKDCGLVKQEKSAWIISVLGYPTIRQFLYEQGFLIDQF